MFSRTPPKIGPGENGHPNSSSMRVIENSMKAMETGLPSTLIVTSYLKSVGRTGRIDLTPNEEFDDHTWALETLSLRTRLTALKKARPLLKLVKPQYQKSMQREQYELEAMLEELLAYRESRKPMDSGTEGSTVETEGGIQRALRLIRGIDGVPMSLEGDQKVKREAGGTVSVRGGSGSVQESGGREPGYTSRLSQGTTRRTVVGGEMLACAGQRPGTFSAQRIWNQVTFAAQRHSPAMDASVDQSTTAMNPEEAGSSDRSQPTPKDREIEYRKPFLKPARRRGPQLTGSPQLHTTSMKNHANIIDFNARHGNTPPEIEFLGDTQSFTGHVNATSMLESLNSRSARGRGDSWNYQKIMYMKGGDFKPPAYGLQPQIALYTEIAMENRSYEISWFPRNREMLRVQRKFKFRDDFEILCFGYTMEAASLIEGLRNTRCLENQAVEKPLVTSQLCEAAPYPVSCYVWKELGLWMNFAPANNLREGLKGVYDVPATLDMIGRPGIRWSGVKNWRETPPARINPAYTNSCFVLYVSIYSRFKWNSMESNPDSIRLLDEKSTFELLWLQRSIEFEEEFGFRGYQKSIKTGSKPPRGRNSIGPENQADAKPPVALNFGKKSEYPMDCYVSGCKSPGKSLSMGRMEVEPRESWCLPFSSNAARKSGTSKHEVAEPSRVLRYLVCCVFIFGRFKIRQLCKSQTEDSLVKLLSVGGGTPYRTLNGPLKPEIISFATYDPQRITNKKKSMLNGPLNVRSTSAGLDTETPGRNVLSDRMHLRRQLASSREQRCYGSGAHSIGGNPGMFGLSVSPGAGNLEKCAGFTLGFIRKLCGKIRGEKLLKTTEIYGGDTAQAAESTKPNLESYVEYFGSNSSRNPRKVGKLAKNFYGTTVEQNGGHSSNKLFAMLKPLPIKECYESMPNCGDHLRLASAGLGIETLGRNRLPNRIRGESQQALDQEDRHYETGVQSTGRNPELIGASVPLDVINLKINAGLKWDSTRNFYGENHKENFSKTLAMRDHKILQKEWGTMEATPRSLQTANYIEKLCESGVYGLQRGAAEKFANSCGIQSVEQTWRFSMVSPEMEKMAVPIPTPPQKSARYDSQEEQHRWPETVVKENLELRGPSAKHQNLPSESTSRAPSAAIISTSPGEMDSLGSSSRSERPILVLGPKDSFVVRNRPATLTCRALYAKRIRFKCNGKWIDSSYHVTKEGSDPISGLPYFEASVPIHRKEVEEYFGLDGFQCECYASASRDESAVKSDAATVKVAFLRKHFYSSPASERRPLGSTIQLPCMHPDGDPKPEIFWLKNDAEIGRGDDSNIILANDGSLIVSSARLMDTGNYTCGARNLATRRLSQTATLTIYVDGNWSIWGRWSGSCSDKCDESRSGVPKLQRHRRCDNPAPVHGKECIGAPQEWMDCPSKCPVDGRWSGWTEWSECKPDCRLYRNRECDQPPPRNGGKTCFGTDMENRNCTGGYCQRGGFPAASTFENNLAMYAGLSVALFLFLLLLSLLLWLFFRKRPCCRKTKADEIYYTGSTGHLRAVMGVPPDLTHNTLLVNPDGSIKAIVGGGTPLPEFSSFSLKSGRSGSSGGYSQHGRFKRENLRNMNILAGSKTALLENGSSSHSSHPPSIDSAEKQRCMSRASNSEEHYATLYDFPALEGTAESTLLTSSLPPQIEVESFAVARVDHRGARVTIPQCGVTLTVPEGAFEKRQTEEIYVAVCRGIAENPRLSDGETLLSPVVWCGPPGLSLRKPVVLSFPHCAQLFPLNNWLVSLQSNDGLPGDHSEWSRVVTVGQENMNTPVYCQLDLDSAHVMTDSLCRYALTGRTKGSMTGAVKRMKLAAFAPLFPSSLDYSLRVYCVEDTDAALQGIVEEEEEQGAVLVADTKELSCQEGGDLCLCLEDISPGWQVKPGSNYQEIPASHVWATSSSAGGLHCSFSLELIEGLREIRNLSARIVVYQKGTPNSRQILLVNTSVQAERASSRGDPTAQTMVSQSGDGTPSSIRLVQSSSPSSSSSSGSSLPPPGFKLPHTVKRRICAALDPPTEAENDWRMLARMLSVDQYIQFFGFRPSPTEHILDLWEAREANSSQSVVTQLLQTLRAMGREDAASPLESFLLQHPVSL